ncbi:MAG: hypothetical protein JXM74_03005 [Fusobacteriaceae bacterium]|nr:hypothetical protein [Fusobacteriaceae bacterium]MBN2837700.1 hypothetical protein [Fusobacteriaceae bacterium]
MKKNIILLALFLVYLVSCGGGSSSTTAISTTSTTSDGSSIANGTGEAGTYTFSSSNLSNSTVYLVANNENFSSYSVGSSVTIKNENTTSTLNSTTTANTTENNKPPKILDIGGKLNKDIPDIEKSNSSTISKSIKSASSLTVGSSSEEFYTYVTNQSTESDTLTTVTAILMAQNTGDRTINVWVANDYTSEITEDEAQDIADSFYNSSDTDNSIYSLITNIYGEEWGDTGYSSLISATDTIDILLTPLNTTYPSDDGYVVGYFYNVDTYKNYSNSNQRNIFYIDAALYSKTANTGYDDYYYNACYSTLAHEFTHMVVWYQKIIKALGLKTSPEIWLNEMMAMISEDLIDDKIKINGVTGEVEGSKDRIPYFNYYYNYYPTICTSSFGLGNYAVNGVLGLYLTRAYCRDNLDVLKSIMTNTGTGYDSIEIATGDSFETVIENFGKALILSGDSTISTEKLNINTSFSVTDGNYSYAFENINIFDTGSYYYTLRNVFNTIKGSGNLYKKIKSSSDSTNSWSIEIPVDNMPFQLIVLNSDGSFNSSLSSELNDSITKS